MKTTPLIARRLLSLPFASSSALRNVSGLASTCIEPEKPDFLIQKQDCTDTLYQRISLAGNEHSITPILDQWANEGRKFDRSILLSSAKQLSKHGRFNHALQVLNWMSNRGSIYLSAGNIAVLLNLMSKVHGSEQVEDFFNKLPQRQKNHQTYGALLISYAHEKLVDKAEALMEEMRGLGYFNRLMCYSVMLKLYYQLDNLVKLDKLAQEMDREGIRPNEAVYDLLVNAYGRVSDVDAMNKIVSKAESDYCLHRCCLGPSFYSTAANWYLRSGLLDKGIEYLQKAEELISLKDKKDTVLPRLLTLYALAGKKDEVLRIWEKCKNRKTCNKDYMSILSSLLKFNDFEAAEKILEEWDSADLSHAMHIPNLLISAYCRNGLVEKAERVVNRKGLQPNSYTWSYLCNAYIEKNRMQEAVEAMKSAVLTCTPKWKPSMESLVACLSYLIEEKDMELFVELTGLLKSKGFVSDELLMKLKMQSTEVEFGVNKDECERN